MCASAGQVLAGLADELGFALTTTDVDEAAAAGDVALRAEYGDRLPVVLLDGRGEGGGGGFGGGRGSSGGGDFDDGGFGSGGYGGGSSRGGGAQSRPAPAAFDSDLDDDVPF